MKTPDIGDVEIQALVEFRAEHGRVWKSKLRDLWMQGHDTGALRRVRNTVGPSGLDRLKLPEVEDGSPSL